MRPVCSSFCLTFLLLGSWCMGMEEDEFELKELNAPGELSLHRYYFNNDMQGFRRAVLEKGYDIDQSDQHGQRVLHIAAMQNKSEWIVLLLSLKSSIDAKDSRFKWSPIQWACAAGRRGSFLMLRDFGAVVMCPQVVIPY